VAKKETLDQKTARLRALRLEREAQKSNLRTSKPSLTDLYPVYDLDSMLKFGKHAGEIVEDVLETDPGWLQWALENIKEFVVTDAVEEELRALGDPRRPVERDC
jgi:3'-phosphoadenosine 5'-phosphosulfate sulfotransferase